MGRKKGRRSTRDYLDDLPEPDHSVSHIAGCGCKLDLRWDVDSPPITIDPALKKAVIGGTAPFTVEAIDTLGVRFWIASGDARSRLTQNPADAIEFYLRSDAKWTIEGLRSYEQLPELAGATFYIVEGDGTRSVA